MTKTIKLAVMGAVLAVGVVQSNAQTTNSVLNVNFTLTGFRQNSSGGTSPVRINTRDILNVLTGIPNVTSVQVFDTNGAPVLDTNGAPTFEFTTNGVFDFSPRTRAKLVLLTQVGSTTPLFAVRTVINRTNVDTDISAYMSFLNPPNIGNFNAETNGTVSSARQQYTIDEYYFNSGNGADFDVSGYTMINSGNVNARGVGMVPGVVRTANSAVSGVGHVNGPFAVLKGTVNASGGAVEVKKLPVKSVKAKK